MKNGIFMALVFIGLGWSFEVFGQSGVKSIKLSRLSEIPQKEIWTYLNALENQHSLPDSIFGLSTSGDFAWSGFFLSLCGYNAAAKNLNKIGQEMPIIPENKMLELGKLCFEKDFQGTTFSQLYLLKSLSFFGKNLQTNILWQSFRILFRENIKPLQT